MYTSEVKLHTHYLIPFISSLIYNGLEDLMIPVFIILYCVLWQVHSLFFVFPSLLSFLLSFLECQVLKGSPTLALYHLNFYLLSFCICYLHSFYPQRLLLKSICNICLYHYIPDFTNILCTASGFMSFLMYLQMICFISFHISVETSSALLVVCYSSLTSAEISPEIKKLGNMCIT